MTLVYAFGDSHTRCAERASGVLSVHLGPILLHRLGRPDEAVRLLQPHWGGGDGIMVIAGEIDVRSHVGKQIEDRERTIEDIIDDLGDRAALCVDELQRAYDVPVYFCAVIPPSRAHEDHPDFPRRGSLSQRAMWTLFLNAVLAARIRTFYDPYAGFREHGILPEWYSDGSVHLHPDHGQAAFGPLVERMTG